MRLLRRLLEINVEKCCQTGTGRFNYSGLGQFEFQILQIKPIMKNLGASQSRFNLTPALVHE